MCLRRRQEPKLRRILRAAVAKKIFAHITTLVPSSQPLRGCDRYLATLPHLGYRPEVPRFKVSQRTTTLIQLVVDLGAAFSIGGGHNEDKVHRISAKLDRNSPSSMGV